MVGFPAPLHSHPPPVAPQVSELELSTLPSVMPSQPGLGLSLSLVTSQKIVDRAHLGQFVDMRDLLTEKVSLLQQLDTVGGHHAFPFLPGMLKPRLRDVTSLTAGIYWFLAYIAIKLRTGLRGSEAWWLKLVGL